MSEDALAGFVETAAAEFGVPGAAVGVLTGTREMTACYGVTSVENPLPVDRDTLFVTGSVTKTFTATALMCLVADGRVDLDAPVRRYVPDLVLPDERAAAEITVRQLTNHTAGLDWRLSAETGDGDDALAAYVARMAESSLVAPPGTRVSYSQVGYNLIGRIIETVSGMTYERALGSLVVAPLGLSRSAFALDEIMTRRFAVGHNVGPDATPAVARQWKDTRANNPGGGLASSVADLVRWARFHLGDGAPILPTALLRRMTEPTAAMHGSSLGDAVGIGWFLRDVDGVPAFGHGGSANGQFAELLLVPDRKFAVIALSNVGPDGGLAFNRAAVRWALERWAGIADRDPEPLAYDDARARDIAGRYDNDVMTLVIAAQEGRLTIECRIKPEIRANTDTELPPDLPPADLGPLPGDADDYIVTTGGLAGQRCAFIRDGNGTVASAQLAGRSFERISEAAERR